MSGFDGLECTEDSRAFASCICDDDAVGGNEGCELGLADSSDGLDTAFADVESYLGKCRFSDCRHESEPGCAIRAAIAAGELDAARWESYRKLTLEAKSSEEMLRRKQEWGKAVAKSSRLRKKLQSGR